MPAVGGCRNGEILQQANPFDAGDQRFNKLTRRAGLAHVAARCAKLRYRHVMRCGAGVSCPMLSTREAATALAATLAMVRISIVLMAFMAVLLTKFGFLFTEHRVPRFRVQSLSAVGAVGTKTPLGLVCHRFPEFISRGVRSPQPSCSQGNKRQGGCGPQAHAEDTAWRASTARSHGLPSRRLAMREGKRMKPARV